MKKQRLKKFTNKNTGSNFNAPIERCLKTQSDYYEQGVYLEEQAERWFLSDIKKTLKFIYQALIIYDQGLTIKADYIKDSYSIEYNRLRLLLKCHSDYICADGYINIINYVKDLDKDLLQVVFPGLKAIILGFENMYNKYSYQQGESMLSWDFYFNYLTCLSIYIDTNEDYQITGGDLIELMAKFVTLTQKLIITEIGFLENFSAQHAQFTDEDYGDESKYEKDNVDQLRYNVTTGDGIKTNNVSSGVVAANSNAEIMEMSDNITVESLIETLILAYNFIFAVYELTLNNSAENINLIQRNYIQDFLNKFYLQLNDICGNAILNDYRDKNIELTMAINSIMMLKEYNNFELIKRKFTDIIDNANATELALETLLYGIDFLQLILDICCSNNGGEHDYSIYTWDEQWTLSNLLNKYLVAAQKKLTIFRNSILQGTLKDSDNQLSPTVFKLCEVMINRATNEEFRILLQINKQEGKEKQAENGEKSASKTISILKKNRVILLTNAKNIASLPCGFREYINNKLERNYIFLQANDALESLENQGL
ncbi:uncharacterized protein SCODWIG_02714 [Saccharomycodes ludwigii]|uniref:Uncharacterized protein n=1 Tax=Saccharomycodes ludwigii TaxID=36035 RepID=A0A376B8C4_9ASCO|nr:uncharacterized protein SCODWIG_02714 [Saccharomycodes ludwigii]